MSLDDFEELLPDKPDNEKWELIGGLVVRMAVGARWRHKRIIQNVSFALMAEFRRRGADRRPFDKTFILARFRAKWIPVRVKKTRQNKNLEYFHVSTKHENTLVFKI